MGCIFMFCRHCGKEISDDSAFCKYCGDKTDEKTDVVPGKGDTTSCDAFIDSLVFEEDDNTDKRVEEIPNKQYSSEKVMIPVTKILSFAAVALLVLSFVLGSYNNAPYETSNKTTSSDTNSNISYSKKTEETYVNGRKPSNSNSGQNVVKKSYTTKDLVSMLSWDELKEKYQTVTRQIMLDRTSPPNSFIIVEGIIDNISEETFDLWIPHNGSYYCDNNYNYFIDLSDITNGCTVQVCVETYNDGSFKKLDGIVSIRRLDVEVVDDIVYLYKNSCTIMDQTTYKEIMRKPDEFYGSIWKVYGTVFQIVESEDYLQEFLLKTTDGDMIYISFHKERGTPYLLEDDEICVYGDFYMTYTYTTFLGSNKTVPKLSIYHYSFCDLS